MSTDTKMPKFIWDDRISESDRDGSRVHNPLSAVVDYIESLPDIEVGDVTVRYEPPDYENIYISINKPHSLGPLIVKEILRLLGGKYMLVHKTRRRCRLSTVLLLGRK